MNVNVFFTILIIYVFLICWDCRFPDCWISRSLDFQIPDFQQGEGERGGQGERESQGDGQGQGQGQS
mgnify:CR=1 FL=1